MARGAPGGARPPARRCQPTRPWSSGAGRSMGRRPRPAARARPAWARSLTAAARPGSLDGRAARGRRARGAARARAVKVDDPALARFLKPMAGASASQRIGDLHRSLRRGEAGAHRGVPSEGGITLARFRDMLGTGRRTAEPSSSGSTPTASPGAPTTGASSAGRHATVMRGWLPVALVVLGIAAFLRTDRCSAHARERTSTRRRNRLRARRHGHRLRW